MAELKIKGDTSGSVSLVAPTSGSDVSLTLPSTTMNLGSVLDSKLDLAGGKILQVVRSADTTDRTTTSTTLVDTNMSLTITPTSASSSIIILTSVYLSPFNSPLAMEVVLTDAANAVIDPPNSGAIVAQVGYVQHTMIQQDSPATTSATTYKLRFRAAAAGGTARLRNSYRTGQMYAIEVSA